MLFLSIGKKKSVKFPFDGEFSCYICWQAKMLIVTNSIKNEENSFFNVIKVNLSVLNNSYSLHV
jgi:hypothetical protein